ncbi:putative defense protein 3 isoform X2 [Haliotis rufescens]|uniref:putative defense protein 3 isoform X2 n=1 Tax=Haliotis rufescens TaxID=6454 RepID=UPI00201EBA23|nr:putative defense protein 3 isoform X2 [Haliotis rufescens]
MKLDYTRNVAFCTYVKTGSCSGSGAGITVTTGSRTLTTLFDCSLKELEVTLNATATDGYFEGFLVQARCTKCSTADTAIVPGTFAKYTASDGTIQTMDCLNVTKNSITHTSEFKKKSVMFTWKVPAGYDVSQGIKFRATVVKSLRTWWNTVMSDEISVTTSSCSRSASAMAVVIGSIIASLLLSHYL